ncbi:DNA-processing protein DprA [Pseudomonas sp. BC42]|uniref:DNA-processing protein DprA n=1 Tax=Pseudomonas sp. BC42 TaxID=2933816 RepID=UPI001F489339|nr:DNA-processing protein DprA [Pseudomonas sp. BC42]ULT72999.1 DNA-protecting protein DprA [Pseudomonas sp. BC42]
MLHIAIEAPYMTTSIAHTKIFNSRPISPLEEMCAYESLWQNQGAWFANLADLFRKNPGAIPSDLVDADRIADTLENLKKVVGEEALSLTGIRVHGAGEYPEKLRDADHPVELLYFQGNWELVETNCVAIVGTRNPSEEGAFNAGRIAHSLVKNGFTVVSGLAKGIDTAAHNAALAAGGNTIAVIGTPLNDYYPKENKELQDHIAQKHLLISQVPFLRYKDQSYKTNRLFFPARNVTMSALTSATIIVEAGNTSGTLVQARAALAQKRKLFILESCFRNTELNWPARFEKLGAIRVQNVSDIIGLLTDDKANTA